MGLATGAVMTARLWDALSGEIRVAHRPGCVLSSKILDTPWAGISVAIAGERRNDASVHVYQPGNDEPMEVWTSKTDYFVGTSEPYIRQQYSSGDSMQIGEYYRAEATLDGKTTSNSFELLQAELFIYANCN